MTQTRPTLFLSYSHDSPEHSTRVRTIAERLVAEDGFDCRLDQWTDAPAEGWPAWCDRQLDEADFILVVCTEGYYRKSKGQLGAQVGLGVRFESVMTVQMLYTAGMVTDKIIPIMFEELDIDLILRPLQPFSHYRVDQEDGYQKLIRRMWGVQQFQRPELGPVPDFSKQRQAVEQTIPTPHAEAATEVTSTTTRSEFATAVTSEATPHNLPEIVSLFIGREQEIAHVTSLLAEERLVTLVGSPGCGKTRLATTVARHLLKQYDNGIWLVRLAEVTDPALVPQIIARSLGYTEQAAKPPTQYLASALGSQHMLLVLDNCEHVIEACAQIIEEILEKCPNVSLLTTSRTPVMCAGEHVWEVPPMDIPPQEGPWQVESLLQYESVRLFVELGRSMPRGQTFEVKESNASAIAQICRQLDGIPLALELAAAQLAYLSAPQIAQHLDQALSLLKKSRRTALSQHRTLKATLDWSYELLDPTSKRLFARLGVFVGGCSWEAAATVCGEPGDSPFEILAPLERLINQSLLQRQDDGDNARYSMLEVVRQYSQAHLEDSGEQGTVENRYRDEFLGLATRSKPELLGSKQDKWLDHLQAEHLNLRSALRISISNRDVLEALTLGSCLWRFWEIRGYLNEGRRKLGRLLALPAEGHEPVYAELLSAAGTLAYRQGDFAAADDLAARALEMERQLDNRPGIANALNDLGNVANKQGRLQDAFALYSEALELKKVDNDDRQMGVAYFNVGSNLLRRGSVDEATLDLERSLKRFEATGNRWETGFPLRNLGLAALHNGHYEKARSYLIRSHDARAGRQDKRGMGDALTALALAETWFGDESEARQYLGAALERRLEVGDETGKIVTLEAASFWAARIGKLEAALKMAAAATALRKKLAFPLDPLNATKHQELLLGLAQSLDEDRYRAVENEGQLLDLKAAVDLCNSLL